MLSSFIYKLSVITRAKDWRLSFVPFIMGCVYLWLWWFKVTFSYSSVSLIFFSLITIFGFAALGYFINDFFDRDCDARAGKLNRLVLLSAKWQMLLLAAILLFTFTPWLVLPSNTLSWQLIAIEIILFLAYSLPFPRLKEKIWLSLIADTMYAYVIPLVLLFHTYNLFIHQTGFPVWFMLFLVAAFFIGIRNILLHQIKDVLKDSRSGIETLPMRMGIKMSYRLLLICTAYEILFVLLWSALLYQERHFFILWMVPYSIIAFNSLKTIASPHYRVSVNELSINQAYQYLFPVLTLVFACIPNPEWVIVLPLHILFLVPFYLLTAVREIMKRSYYGTVTFIAVDVRNVVSSAFNYPVYYLFRVFGIDLLKEKKSAFKFLSGKLKGR